LSLLKHTSLLLCSLLLARPVVAQDTPPSTLSAASVGELTPWQPLGPAPVDQAGSGGRGYVLAGENADVVPPGAQELSLQSVIANYFYLETRNNLTISQRFETHTLALEYRRGFKVATLPLFDVGVQWQVQESDPGKLNGFITMFEDFVHASLRSRLPVPPPLGMAITQNHKAIYHAPVNGAGIGDLSFVVKAALRDGDPSSRTTRVAVRLEANVAGASRFTEGNLAGAGISFDRKVRERLALHGDLRADVVLDRVSAWNLPLKRGVIAYSWGPEFRLSRKMSLDLQVDGSTTPYQPTGTVGLDANYGDLTFGVNRRFAAGRRWIIVQWYGRENVNMPFSVRWNTDPDFAIGMKLGIR
jgi:hypothetical protein